MKLLLVKDGDTVVCAGFIASNIPEALEIGVEERFAKTGSPKDLTVVYVAGTGNQDGSSIDHFAHEGLVKKVIGGTNSSQRSTRSLSPALLPRRRAGSSSTSQSAQSSS